jgi:triosephosphate isomerase
MRKFLVAGNWKMNGDSAANSELVGGIIAGLSGLDNMADNVEVLVCPPFPYLAAVRELVKGSALRLGAQNVSAHASGAHTGETSPAMLRDVGCEFALVGHSERRSLYGETSEQVAAKFVAAQAAAGLTPVLCVGETLAERESESTEAVINEQLAAVLDTSGIGAIASAVIAYEPVWAIGTGMTATPEQAQDVHRYIRGVLKALDADVAASVQILYGGSVKGDNAAGLFGMPDIDGGLIGGASLKAADFLAIIAAAATL